jgi:MFS transporter, FSR family, fosmidomycin resistance protein
MSNPAIAARGPLAPAERRRRAIGLLGVSSAHGVNHMYAALLPLAYPLIMVQFHFSYTILGLVIAFSNVTGGFLQAAFGFINRRVSARMLLGYENIALGLCVALMGLTGNVFQFGAVRWLGTVAGSPQHPVGAAYCAEEYPDERGFAISSHIAGGNIGTLVVPILGAFAIEKLGWRPTLFIFAVPIALMGILTFFLLRPNVEVATERTEPKDEGIMVEVKRIMSRKTVLLIILASTIAAGGRGLGVIMTYMPLYLTRQLRFGTLTTGILFNLMLVGSVVGTLAAGRISDRLGRKRMLISVYAAALIAMVLLLVVGASLALLFPVLIFVGLTTFAESSVLQAFFADSISDSSHRIGFGVYFTIAYGIGALWALIIGTLVDHFGFHTAFIVMGLSYIAAAAVLLPVHDPRQKGAARS